MPSAACRSSTPPYRDHDLDASTLRNREQPALDTRRHLRRRRQRPHTGNGAQVLATLRNTAISLHRLNGADNIAEACRITALTANRRLDLLNPQFPSSQAC
ncbi:transposase family protein [Mycobacterium ulcerans str. Harvey]|uniref:Transposase family protein n=1 Tax=Mycobacterium ulcerans str. Harvey TaxID=1299332 RepID=A0ABP3AJR2_MYCUL|nr:transposase family protein [Mycobacterium ulcerans str. Harvey]